MARIPLHWNRDVKKDISNSVTKMVYEIVFKQYKFISFLLTKVIPFMKDKNNHIMQIVQVNILHIKLLIITDPFYLKVKHNMQIKQNNSLFNALKKRCAFQ